MDLASAQKDKKKILLCEDEQIMAEMILDTLSDTFRMHWSSSGEKALEDIKTFHPDLIVMDIGMPGLGGYEVVRELQRDPAANAIPVVFLTGQKLDETTEKMLKFEPNVKGFLRKPCNPQTIIETVNKILSRK